jgi:hypothetical protein
VAFFANALEGAFAQLRAEFLDQMAALRRDVEVLKRGEEAGDGYLTIDQVCVKYATSRSTVYRMIDDPDLGLEELIIRVPPRTGPRRLPVAALEEIFRGRKARRGGKTKRNERNA